MNRVAETQQQKQKREFRTEKSIPFRAAIKVSKEEENKTDWGALSLNKKGRKRRKTTRWEWNCPVDGTICAMKLGHSARNAIDPVQFPFRSLSNRIRCVETMAFIGNSWSKSFRHFLNKWHWLRVKVVVLCLSLGSHTCAYTLLAMDTKHSKWGSGVDCMQICSVHCV